MYPPRTDSPPTRDHPSRSVDVLIVEDEAVLQRAIAEYLEAAGLRVEGVSTAEEARTALRRTDPGVLLLDVNLPGDSGFSLCREVRNTSSVPLIFLSARAGEDDQILGLALGGDDYLTKPFSLAVLHAKVRRALDRSGSTAPVDFDDGHLRIDDASGRVWLDGAELHLTATEDRLLRHLVARRGQVASKQDIIDAVWGDPFTSDGTLTVHIRRLRSRIEPDPHQPRYITTVWGRGYLFQDGS